MEGRQSIPIGYLPLQKSSFTLLVGVLIARFFPDTLLLRMRLKLCLKDFFKDLTLDRGPSIAKESFGCSVHLEEQQCIYAFWIMLWQLCAVIFSGETASRIKINVGKKLRKCTTLK